MKNLTLAAAAGALLLTALGAGCVPKPKQDYTPDQVKTLDSIEELMRVQAATADPQFNHIGQANVSDSEFASMGEAAHKLQNTADTLRSRMSQNRPPSFTTYATRLYDLSGELVAAPQAKDGAKGSTTLTGIRDTCRTCHKEHR